MHRLGHVEAELVIHDKRGAALAGLRVDADRLIRASEILRIDREIRHHPLVRAGLVHELEALVDRVLMAARERGEYQIAAVRLTLRHLHLGAALIHRDDALHLTEIQLRVHALNVHIHRNRNHIHIAGALAVAEQACLDALRACEQSHLGGSDTAAAVVVRMQRDDRALTSRQLADKILQLVGELIRHAVFHRGRQVQNDAVIRVRMQMIEYGGADLDGGVHLGSHERLRRVLKAQIHAGGDDRLCHLIDQIRRVGGDLLDAVDIRAEYHLALQRRGRVVEVEDHVLGALNRLKRLFDQMRARLHQNLNRYVVRDMTALDQLAADLVVGVRGGRKADLDFLDADLIDQHVEHLELFLHVHRVDERLIAVSQIDRAPGRRLGDRVVRPGAVFDRLRHKRDVFFIAFHVVVLQIVWCESGPAASSR